MTAALPTTEPKPNRRFALVVIGVIAVCLLIGGWWGANWYRTKRRNDRIAELKVVCKQLTDDERWEDLEEISRGWTDWDPSTDDGWLYLADARLQQGDPVEAQEFLRKVPDASDKVVAALLLASELQLGSANQPLEAPGTLKRLIELRPTLITPQQRLIFFYALTLQRTEMIRQIREAITARTEPKEAYVYLVISSQLSFTNGFSLTSRWLQSDPESELLQVARAVHFSDTLDNAADADEEPAIEKRTRQQNLVNLLNRYPDNRALLRYFLHRKYREFDVAAVGKLIEQIPPEASDESLFWRYRAWHAAQIDELDDAERYYEQSLELDPLEWQSWHELAGVLRRLKKLDEAEQAQQISVVGKELRKELMQMPDVAAVTPELLQRIRDYAAMCGDQLITEALDDRLYEIRTGVPPSQIPSGLLNP